MNREPMGVNDALSLGKAKFAILGVQHLFAMFGATIHAMQTHARSF